jgi:RNA polymerase sigma factor (sigma-70 family)
MEDAELLRQYVDSGSAEAFNQLMSRHIDLVYAAARRQIRNEHLAQDVTQAVFILLAEKAATVRGGSALPGWLLLTTYYASRDARKLQMRRRLHEHKAAEMTAALDRNTDEAPWGVVGPELDAALARLSTKYRNIVAMHFMENRTFREVGAAMGMSEDAARISCARAVQKLKRLLARRGAMVSAVGLAGMMVNQKVHAAPPEVYAQVSAAANSALGGPSTNAVMIARQVSHAMKWTRISLAGGAVCSTILLTASALMFFGGSTWRGGLFASSASAAALSSSAAQPASLSMEGNFHGNAHIEFLGVTRLGDPHALSWKADGQPADLPPAAAPALEAAAFTSADLDHRELYRFAFRLRNVNPNAHDLWMLVSGAPAGFRGVRLQGNTSPAGGIVYGVAPLAPEQTVANVCVALSSGDWDTITFDPNGHSMGRVPKTLRPFASAKVQQCDAGTALLLPTDPFTRYDFRCLAVSSDGTEFSISDSAPRYMGTVGDGPLPSIVFNQPLEKIARFEFSIRHSRDFTIFRHVSLRPGISNDAFVDGSFNLADVDGSLYDANYLDLFHQVVKAVEAKDAAAARRACAKFVTATKPKVESIEGTSHAYLLVTGEPVLNQLVENVNAEDCDAALSLLDAEKPPATHLWQMTNQLALRQPVKSLQYP